jgi:hypothetical protein
VEAFLILAVAAGLSAVVVWWATNLPGRSRPKAPRTASRSPPRATAALPEASATEPAPASDGGRFVLLPTDSDEPVDDRPRPVWSLLRLALTIAFFAALGVGVLAVLGYLVKTQLDQYFTGL